METKSGVIGLRLVLLFVAEADQLRALGAEPVVCDVFDAPALAEAVASFRSEVVLDELPDLPEDEASISEFRHANARIRREGTRNLLAAAQAAGVGRAG